MTTANAELAEQLRRRADDAMRTRKALLCASVALAETKTIASARKVLADPDLRIPAAVKSEALGVLAALTEDVPANQGGAAQEGTT